MKRVVTEADLVQFCTDQQIRSDDRAIDMGVVCEANQTEHTYSIGPKYARIIRRHPTNNYNTSVVCFIDMTNGDILKGSWKAPVKNGVRGNIFTPDRGASCMTGYGPKYLR